MIKFLKPIIAFTVLFVLFFYILNFKAFNIQILYWWNSNYNKDSQKQVDAYLPQIGIKKYSKPVWQENHLVIPKLSLNVPIVWNVPYDKSLEYLSQGVIHTKGTALPAQSGNVFISGHSSYFWDGPYSSIFSVIHNLQNGDEIAIVWQGYTYNYRVYNKVVVLPNQVEYLNQDRSKHMLTLMTCTPIGTDWKRLIVQAKLIN